VGYNKWQADCGVTFIKSSAKWRMLGIVKELCITPNSVEDHYNNFIFRYFHKLDKHDRYEQLRHIKDKLFDKIKYDCSKYSSSNPSERRSKSLFIKGLKDLKCIEDNGSFYCVSEFCDPTFGIFQTFSWNYRFPPAEYLEEHWLSFLRELNLKQTVSENEFLDLCREVESGQVEKSITECSKTLLSFLFSNSTEHYSQWFFMTVAQISFVEQEKLPYLTWAAPSVLPCGQLVKLHGSALISRAPLLWTTKPIIKLSDSYDRKIAQAFGILVDPRFIDIVENIAVLSKTKHAKWNNFNTYPTEMKCPKEGMTLLKIMEMNLKYLTENLEVIPLDRLKSMSCIPVFHTNDSSDRDESKMVLVKPNQVIHDYWKCGDVEKLHPFLFMLPEDLSLLSRLLKEIGVKNEIDLCHVQVVLEFIYDVSKDEELDPNTDQCVKKAIEILEKILQKRQRGSVSEIDKLYLPDSENKLRESTNLIYIDSENYEDCELSLDGVSYYHFDIRTPEYKVDARDLCNVLPKNVKPIGLSEVCQKKVMSTAIELSVLAEQLENIFSSPEISEGLVLYINKFLGKQKNDSELKKVISCWLDSVEITTVEDLNIDIIMTKDNKRIGKIASKYSFTSDKEKMVLYLDSSLTLSDTDDIENVYTELASHLLNKMCNCLNNDATKYDPKNKILTFIKRCFASSTKEKLEKHLKKHNLNFESKMEALEKKLGQVIPDCWHHRLAQDIDNVFNPMEYVGYEVKDGRIIVAQVAFPVTLKEQQQEFEKKYHIYIGQDDHEGTEVSVLSLYKFLPGSRTVEISSTTPTTSKEVAIFDGEDKIIKIRSRYADQDLRDIYKRLCQQLTEIWKLSISLRKTAIRRLFLFWHPDKNENKDKAEKVFQFLLKQIEHLEKGEPLDDPSRDSAPHYTYQYQGGGRYRRHWNRSYSSAYNFHGWNRTAHQHSQSHESEDKFFSEGRESQWSDQSQYTSQCTTSDYFPFNVKEDRRNPREGRRWLNQAEAEFSVLSLVHAHQDSCSGYGYVCFMSHQVAEKALKGGVYGLCGLDGRSLIDHNLCRHAHSLTAIKPNATEDLISCCAPLDDYYLKTRYPNQWSGYIDIPFDHYKKEEADAAVSHATRVLDIVKNIMPM